MPKKDTSVPTDPPSHQEFSEFASKYMRNSEDSGDAVEKYYGIKVTDKQSWLGMKKKITPNQVVMHDKVLTFTDSTQIPLFKERMRDVLVQELSFSIGLIKVETLEDWYEKGNYDKLRNAAGKYYQSRPMRLINSERLDRADFEIEEIIKKKKWERLFSGSNSQVSNDISIFRQFRKIIGHGSDTADVISIQFSKRCSYKVSLNQNSYFKSFNKDQEDLLGRIRDSINKQNYGDARGPIKKIIEKEKRRLSFSFRERSICRHMRNIYQLEQMDKQCKSIEASRGVISRLDIEQLYRAYTEDSLKNIGNRHRIHAIKQLANDPSHQTRNLGLKIVADDELKKKVEFLTYKLLSESDGINLRKNKLDLETMLGKLESNALSNELYQPVIENIVKYSENTAFVKKAFKLLDKDNKVAVLAEATEENRKIIYGTLKRQEKRLLQPQVDEKIKAISESGNSERSPMKTR